MKTELLQTFLEVTRTLHFRQAADALFITQSAVSARIKLLEDELGVLLFDRSTKHLKLTTEGNRLIKHANELLFLWQKAKIDVGSPDISSSQLTIASMMSVWDIVLVEWLHKVNKNYPDVGLFTSTLSPIELRKKVLNRIVDLAFLFEPPFIEELIAQKVATVPLLLVSTDTEQSLARNTLQNFVLVDYGESINSQLTKDFADIGMAKHFFTQPRIALEFILETDGCAYLPMQLAFEYIEKNKLFLIEDAPKYARDIYAIYLNKGTKLTLIKDTLSMFRQR